MTCEISDIITPSSTAAALGPSEKEAGEEEETAVLGLHAAGGEEKPRADRM